MNRDARPEGCLRSARSGVAIAIAVGVALGTFWSMGSTTDARATSPATSCSPARTVKVNRGIRSFSTPSGVRQYELTVPPEYDGRSRAPLLLSLHGFSSNIAEQDQISRFPSAAGKRGYIVVTPQALDVDVPLEGTTTRVPLWNASGAVTPPAGDQGLLVADDVGFLIALLDHLEETLCVDAHREYVSGISNGAGMAVALVCSDDRRFAAVAPVAGVNTVSICGAKRATPIVAFHGDADQQVPYQGGSFFLSNLKLPPVEDRMTELARLGGCRRAPRRTESFAHVRRLEWKCPKGMGAELYTVLGGGHTWPGEKIGKTTDIDSTKVILDFFDVHRQGAQGTYGSGV